MEIDSCADEAEQQGLGHPAPEGAHHLLCPAPHGLVLLYLQAWDFFEEVQGVPRSLSDAGPRYMIRSELNDQLSGCTAVE